MIYPFLLANRRSLGLLLVATALLGGSASPRAADDADSPAEKQRKLLEVLQSGAPPQDKAMACKRLAIYGGKEAVPALAALLPDADLSSWARIALEAIPDAAASTALRDALGKVQGRLLIGVINSLGYRRDAGAVGSLAERLADADAEVVAAAAAALGRIGGESATKALVQGLASAPAGARIEVAEGCIRCAEKLRTEGQRAEAVRLYDTVRQANVPKHKLLEATRGAILAREQAGLPLLLEELRSPDKGHFNIGLRVARELPGGAVTAALAAEVERASPDRQPLVLLALADRTDAGVLPAVLKTASGGAKKARLAAIGALERLGEASCVGALLDAAGGTDADLAKAAKTALDRLPGKGVDAELLRRLPEAPARQRQVLLELAGSRRLDAGLPAIARSAADADPGVRAAAVEALGLLGGPAEAAELVRLLQGSPAPAERARLEKALLALSSRAGPQTAPHLAPLARSSDSGLRIVALHALAGVGGAEALGAVKAAAADADEAVQDEAVRALSTWPNNWPEDAGVAEPLLALAKSAKKVPHQVLGVRGYLQYLQGDKKLRDDERVARLSEFLPQIQRPEEKRLALAALGEFPTAAAIELLRKLAADPALAEDACSARVNLLSKTIPGVEKDARQKALQSVLDTSKNEATRSRAEAMLKALR